MSKWATIILWTFIGFFTACIALLSSIHLYYYFFPPDLNSQTSDPYLQVSHMFVMGPIVLVDGQIVIVFGAIFVTSLAITIYSIRQCLSHPNDED